MAVRFVYQSKLGKKVAVEALALSIGRDKRNRRREWRGRNALGCQGLSVRAEALEPRTLLSFSSVHSVSLPGAISPLVTANLNGAYNPVDLIAATSTDAEVLTGNGDGTFALTQSIPLPTNSAGQKPFLVGSFNGTTNDIVLLSQASITRNGLVTYETNSGNGSFIAGRASTIQNAGNGFQPLSATVGDFNNDGKIDIAVLGKPVTGSQLVLAILTSNGDGTFTELADYPVNGSNVAANISDEPIAAATLSSQLDVALLDGSGGQLDVFIGDGTGRFTQGASLPTSGSLLTTGSFTTSKNIDLLTAGGNAITEFLGDGNGKFATQPPITVSGNIDAFSSADFNLDGNRDLVTNLGVMLGNGDGTFNANTSLPISVNGGGGTSNTLVAADLNRDGKPDVVGFDSTGAGLQVAINSALAATAVDVASSQTPALISPSRPPCQWRPAVRRAVRPPALSLFWMEPRCWEPPRCRQAIRRFSTSAPG